MKLNEFYEKKRDEHYRAYKAALEMEDDVLADKHYREYKNYSDMIK